jgi:ferredoxin-NADP reductase
MKHTIKIKSLEHITHDVLRIVTDKPAHYSFKPGQAADLSINKPGWSDKKNPFTFTSLPDKDFLEFTIKTYPEHKDVTNELLSMKANDELILHDVFGDIGYMGEGTFIAGGAGVTPFIAIFRYLQSINAIGSNKLIFANKTKADIILEEEFKSLLGDHFINILSDETIDGYAHGYITDPFLQAHVNDLHNYFYVCGPPPMMDAIEKMLSNLHVDKSFIIKESF